MATVPSFIYLTPQKRLVTSSVDLDEVLLSKKSFEKNDVLGSTWGMQPGVWWKDENKWIMYDRKTVRRILKAQEIGVIKVKFSRAAAAYSQYVSVKNPPDSSLQEIEETKYSRGSDSFDSSSSHNSIGEPEYEIDLINMKEVHLESGERRDIKIGRVSVTGCHFLTFSTSNDLGAKYFIDMKTTSTTSFQVTEEEKFSVSWKDEVEGWCLFSNYCQNTIWSAWTAGHNFVSIEKGKSKTCPKGPKYIIDLKTMQQENSITGHRTSIQIAMWISSSKFPHMWIGEDYSYLAREIGDVSCDGNEIMLHKLALSRLLCPEYVRLAISKNMEHHMLQSLEMNIDPRRSGHWNSFLHSFMRRVREIPDYLGHLWRFALNPNGHHHPENPFTSSNSNVPWRFVFGAPSDGHEVNTLKKFRATALPPKYDTHIDWFGLSSSITEFYCKPVSDGVVHMLVFLTMMPRNFHHSREKVVFLKKIKDYLPVALIKVGIDEKFLGPACSLWEDMNKETIPNPSSSEDESISSSTHLQRLRGSLVFQPLSRPNLLL